MNSLKAQTLIQNVENILYNWDQNSGVSSDKAMAALKRAYAATYGEVPFIGSNKSN